MQEQQTVSFNVDPALSPEIDWLYYEYIALASAKTNSESSSLNLRGSMTSSADSFSSFSVPLTAPTDTMEALRSTQTQDTGVEDISEYRPVVPERPQLFHSLSSSSQQHMHGSRARNSPTSDYLDRSKTDAFSAEEDETIRRLVEQYRRSFDGMYPTSSDIIWEHLGAALQRSPSRCRTRFLSCLDPRVCSSRTTSNARSRKESGQWPKTVY